jgi:uncharacterized protein HemX
MMDVSSDQERANVIARIGAQPIALAAVALVLILLGVGAVAFWRVSSGTSPEQDRIVSQQRQVQARTTQASEQLMEKTRGLETSQQESIDQLQVVQDELQRVKRLLAGQQGETKRLSEQVRDLTESIDTLRQSFASTQTQEASNTPPPTRNKSIRARSRAAKAVHRKRGKSRG